MSTHAESTQTSSERTEYIHIYIKYTGSHPAYRAPLSGYMEEKEERECGQSKSATKESYGGPCGWRSGGAFPCHHVPRHPSKVTHCLWLLPAGLTSTSSLSHSSNQIASSGPTSSLATHSQIHTHTHAHTLIFVS